MAPKKREEPAKDEEIAAPETIVFERSEQEEQCEKIFRELDKMFKRLAKMNKPDKIHASIRDITAKLKQAKELIKDFEREARADGVPQNELAARKKALAAELNGFIALKKEFAQTEGTKADLLNGAVPEAEQAMEGMNMQQLMKKGRTDIQDIDKTLERSERIVEDTKAVGTQVASTLHDQTKKLEKIVDDLNEIEFTMKKASAVIRDITRGLLTDKCIAFLLLLTVVGVVVIIILKIINPNKKKIAQGASAIVNQTVSAINSTSAGSSAISSVTNAVNTAINTTTNAANSIGGRRSLLHRPVLTKALMHLLELNATL
ncbi:hypothetical protein HXX76_007585 [Chlamydomonas incerta]|uniref:t-SNARE coiled-coil homology domain-containing protein n=1 Tax=Chlamydomonas incerta TaxID=51695 RepID=A0A835W0G6_CHLIN|nr:hypothetical protein HXX76_007585 [Chlamydomonas incerta]|eukprot:KAG2434695.1 hypothetical protein HXX76_007585 [Chlamydomonas incerta]